ncbi:MAG: VOC family protein [Nitrososphaerales archaeon]
MSHLEESIAVLATRGVATGPIEQVGGAGRKAIANDPDGNSIALIEVAGAQ